MKWAWIVTGAIVIAVIGFAVYFGMNWGKPADNSQIANPASVYCEQQGGKLEIITAGDGSQSGMCTLKNGIRCEEWAYFRGECGAENGAASCLTDSDCIPDACCHPKGCTAKENVKVCNLLCTQECEPGTLDCGQGSCRCENNKCTAVFNA
jgi:putative hemolysin